MSHFRKVEIDKSILKTGEIIAEQIGKHRRTMLIQNALHMLQAIQISIITAKMMMQYPLVKSHSLQKFSNIFSLPIQKGTYFRNS